MPLPLLSTSPQHYWMCRPSRERMEWPFSVEKENVVDPEWCVIVHVPTWTNAHSHSPHTCLLLVAVMAVFCCVVLRDVALAEAARTSSRKKVVPLPKAVTCSISLSSSFTLLQTVYQAERWLPFIEHPLTPLHSGLPVKVLGMLLVIL